jgi:hypothetical protein
MGLEYQSDRPAAPSQSKDTGVTGPVAAAIRAVGVGARRTSDKRYALRLVQGQSFVVILQQYR